MNKFGNVKDAEEAIGSKLIGTNDAMVMLSVSFPTFQKILSQKNIKPVVKIGKTLYYKEGDILSVKKTGWN